MSKAPERITAWLSKDGSTRFEGGKLFPAGVEVEYVRADRIEELEAESERLRLALEETVSLLWDDMSKQESVGKHGGYIYMKCRAALAKGETE